MAGFLLQAPAVPGSAKGPTDPLMVIGVQGKKSGSQSNPMIIYDVSARVGGPNKAGMEARADVMVEINSDWVILDNVWLWRADHTAGGLVKNGGNPCYHGLVVNGDNVHAYGLFAEHSLKEQVVWNGNNGYNAFFQSEMPYDVQVGWDYPSYNVTGSGHQMYGVGAYCFFRDNPVVVTEGFCCSRGYYCVQCGNNR
eukprot:UN03133